MVGIAGFIHDGHQRPAFLDLDQMGETLANGPGLRLHPAYCDRHVCCLSASLDFNDLHPYIERDLAVWLDGEIYDFGQLGDDIDSSANATAIVALLYRRHGLRFLKNVDGIFAAVIYDVAHKEVHLVTDRYGLRPFYVWKRPNPVWASSLNSFLLVPGFTPTIEPTAIDDFLDLGYMTEEKTWFRDVRLLPSGSVLTWDIHSSCEKQMRYWWWDEIKLVSGRLDEDDVADELGNLFVRAVERRVRRGERVGLYLSGGLDSRANLAAMPNHADPVHAITFGNEGCADRTIAARAAALRDATSHQFSLERDWLTPRFRGVWLTGGQVDLMHMHGIEAVPLMRNLFDIILCGFAGDVVLGGSFLFQDALDRPIATEIVARKTGQHSSKIHISKEYSTLNKTDFFLLQNRIRRLIYSTATLLSDNIETRMPFYDNKLLEFSYSLPDALRLGSRIYKKMLLRKFPRFYEDIPWQKTGYTIRISDSTCRILNFPRRARRKLSNMSRGLFKDPIQAHQYADYPDWVRREPARTIFSSLFNNPKAIFPDYLPKDHVELAWREHLKGVDHAHEIFRYATFEIWLQQVFEKRLLTDADSPGPAEVGGSFTGR